MQAGQGLAENGEALEFGVGEAQALAQALGVLFDPHAQRRQAQQRVRPGFAASFDRESASEARRIGLPGEQRGQQAGLANRRHDFAGAGRRQELQQFGARARATGS
jgi:hypothetical protein